MTDADVVLGLVNPDNFLGGRIKLDAALARKAVEKIAQPLGLSIEDAAEGIKRIVDSQMSDLVRQATVYRGYDPREFILVAFGGAGPVHASSYGADLGVDKIVVPRTASILSAHGILLSDLVVAREQASSLICPAGTDAFSDHIKADELNRVFEELQASARHALDAQGVDIASVDYERYVDVRFRPQIFDMSVDVSKFPFKKADVDRLIEHFIEFIRGSLRHRVGVSRGWYRDQCIPHRRACPPRSIRRYPKRSGKQRTIGGIRTSYLFRRGMAASHRVRRRCDPSGLQVRRAGDRRIRRHDACRWSRPAR